MNNSEGNFGHEGGRILGQAEPEIPDRGFAVRQRCFKLGLKVGRLYPAADDEKIRAGYGKVPTAELAAELKRSVASIYQRARNLGLAKPIRPWDRAADDELMRHNAAGDSDTEIARKLKRDRHSVSARRRQLGLPDQSHGPQSRRAIGQGVKRQLARLGVVRLADLRIDSWRRQAIARGWPEVINGRPISPRYFQILDALHDHGPQTKRQLAERIGFGWKGSRKSLTSNGKGGSYLAELMRAGLVVSLGRCVRQGGKGHNVHLYALDISIERKASDVRDQA